MKISNPIPSARPSQRLADSSTPSTSSTPSSRREAPSVRAAPRDGFENTVSPRNTLAAAPARTGDVQSLFREQFGTLAADKQRFHETMRGVFGEGLDTAKAEQFRQQALSGNFDWMPQVEWVDSDTLQGGQGAYDAGTGKVLLNRELQGDPQLAASTYVEEAGHHLDAQLNTVDSQGDEGELFRRVLGGEKLSGAQVAEMRAENDKGTIQLHGRSVEVEFRRNFFQRLGDGIVNTVKDVGNAVGNAAQAVGNAVGDAAQAVGNAVGNVASGVVNTAKGVAGFFGLGPQHDRKFDGKLVGANGQTFEPGTPLDQLPAVTPSYNSNPDTTVLYVNGMATDLEQQGREMRRIAETTGMRVVGIHNATQGSGVDLAQCVLDKLDKGSNPAVDTLADTVYAELKAGRNVHLMGYSQGALITARALKDVANRLRIEDGMSQAQVEQLMGRINVETFGGAGAIFPDGPQYVHYVNKRDIVPLLFGQGNHLDPLRHPGRGAVVHEFSESQLHKFSEAHALGSTYLSHWVPFDQARAGQF